MATNDGDRLRGGFPIDGSGRQGQRVGVGIGGHWGDRGLGRSRLEVFRQRSEGSVMKE